MGNQTARRGGTSARGDIALLFAVLALIGLVCMLGWSIALARTATGTETSWNPLQVLIELLMGKAEFPLLAVAFLAIPVVGMVAGFIAWARHHKRTQSSRSPIDGAARTMQAPNHLAGLTRQEAVKDAERLLPGYNRHSDNPGILLGATVAGKRDLFMSWESGALVIAGPRMGKTTSIAVPAIMEAPGAVVATSNKGDIYDATVWRRSQRGRVWLLDPQAVTGDATQRFWWNPLERIEKVREARKLASFFADANKVDGARQDAYFDGGAVELLSCLLLAAASAQVPDDPSCRGDLRHTYQWLGDFLSPIPSLILRHAGHDGAARRLDEARELNPRQRDGLVDMARRHLGVLADPEYARLVTPRRRVQIGTNGDVLTFTPGPQVHDLDQFRPEEFVDSRDTLYALSIEGKDSAAALVTALVGQVFEEGVTRGAQSPGRRLTPPLVAVLDEAANVCKLGELPAQYSHFGSRGIIPITFLQSPAQGVGVWGKDGMDALMSAANISIYGGNVKDTQYLDALSKLIGEHDVLTESRSRGQNQASTSQSWKREAILSVSELSGLPANRCIIQSAKNTPVLAHKIPFWERPYADEVGREVDLAASAPDEHVENADENSFGWELDESDLIAEFEEGATASGSGTEDFEVVSFQQPRSPAFGPGRTLGNVRTTGEIDQ